MCHPFHGLAAWLILACGLPPAMSASAQQIDIHGPAGSVAFGQQAYMLPNGNIVAVDSSALFGKGAVYLYTPAGALLSTLTGSSTADQVGNISTTVLANGNFVVSSYNWANGTNANVGP
jgi:trimeric autotransporter adhesin